MTPTSIPPAGCGSGSSTAPAALALHRAIALRYVTGPAAALTVVDALADDLAGYHLFHTIRAELLRDLGHPEQGAARLEGTR